MTVFKFLKLLLHTRQKCYYKLVIKTGRLLQKVTMKKTLYLVTGLQILLLTINQTHGASESSMLKQSILPNKQVQKVTTLQTLALRTVLQDILEPTNIESNDFKSHLSKYQISKNLIPAKRASARFSIANHLETEGELDKIGLLEQFTNAVNKLTDQTLEIDDNFIREITSLKDNRIASKGLMEAALLDDEGLLPAFKHIKHKLTILKTDHSFELYLNEKNIPERFISFLKQVSIPELLHSCYLETYGRLNLIPKWLISESYESQSSENSVSTPNPILTLQIQDLIDYDMLIASNPHIKNSSPFKITQNEMTHELAIFQPHTSDNKIIELDISRGLKNIPNINFDTVRTLNLAHSGFTWTPNAFNDCSSIESLVLKGNFLSEIPGQAFYGLDTLKTLDLSDNNIDYIAPHAFTNLHNLTKIILKNNPIANDALEKKRITNEIKLVAPKIKVVW